MVDLKSHPESQSDRARGLWLVLGFVRGTLAVTPIVLAFTFLTSAQSDVPTFKAEGKSAFVWGEGDNRSGVSSSIQDPITGNAIRKLSHGGIEVSARAGFERIGHGAADEFLSFTTTIANNTGSDLTVPHGGVSINGHVALPLAVVPTKKGLRKRERERVWDLSQMGCFVSGFLANENYFHSSSKAFTVPAKSALTVSFVTKDPRNYPFRCSMEGCYPNGTMRFYVTVNATDYVFIWPGRSSVNCGK
jgi:hypothetical protein